VLRDFTRAKMVNQFDADIKIAEAKLKSDEKTHELDKSKLELIESQIAKCMIKAPAAGQVVYANESGGRSGNDIIIQEGTVVRERQVIIRLPDPQKMQVKAKINESRVDYVHEGLPVKIKLDALPGVDLMGTIKRVNDYPIANGNWFGSSAKEYGTYVEIHDPPKSMRPGMTAEVSIRVEQLENALLLPVQAVFERAGREFCLLPTPSGDFEPREVKIGSANDRFVVIREGLAKDDEVVSNPRKYIHQVDLPADTRPERTEMLAGVPAPGERAKMAEKADRALASADRKLASADGNGKPRRGGGKSGKGGGPGGGKMDPGAIAGMMMQRMDKNNDGKLDASEMADLPEQFRAGLQGGDTNNDGVVDAKELAAAMQKFRAAGGGGGRPPLNAGGGGASP
jgi:RND family efflux transporter MFP subunit